ncbi:MAG: hypothetical protein JXR94_21890 [Candidatus Hydrogenedentes bacterium]|nr:hypothetical protein [Candidatus Hydrogenedentota bacterium]
MTSIVSAFVLMGLGASAEPLDIGSRLELFMDDYLIESMDGVALQMHQPIPKEICIVHDAPWEGSGTGYHTVFQDGDLYRMYYKAWEHPANPQTQGKEHPLYTGYAESRDGKVWEKPNLGLFDVMGTKENNLVWIEDGSHCFTPFKDGNPACKPEERYKAVSLSDKTHHLHGYVSPDGIHWTELAEPLLTKDVGAFDSQNLVFWDTLAGEYRAYFRTFRDGVRTITTAVSEDFKSWTDVQDIVYNDDATMAFYTNVIKPYYRAPHILIGFPVRYCDRGWSPSMRALPMREHREGRAEFHPRYGTTVTDSVMITSRDGLHFNRWGEAFIRPGLRTADNWVYGDNYIAWQTVVTKADMENAPDELSFYATESYWTDTYSKLRRYTMRIDGFVSVNAPFRGGEFVTKPFVFTGSQLVLNFSTSAAGTIQIELQGPDGTPIPGFTMEHAPPVFGDDLARVVPWPDGADLSGIKGRPVRLRFRMSDADIYSMQFVE